MQHLECPAARLLWMMEQSLSNRIALKVIGLQIQKFLLVLGERLRVGANELGLRNGTGVRMLLVELISGK